MDPRYREHYFRPPIGNPSPDEGIAEKWVVYANDWVAAKEATVLPGRTAVLKDAAAYGCIVVQGHGRFGAWDAEAAGTLRYGQPSGDEYFVGEQAAADGVVVVNASPWEPMVILQHFGPNNREAPRTPAGRTVMAKRAQAGTLFPLDLPANEWLQFPARDSPGRSADFCAGGRTPRTSACRWAPSTPAASASTPTARSGCARSSTRMCRCAVP